MGKASRGKLQRAAARAKPKSESRSQPMWLRIILNLCAFAGLVVTLMGWINPLLGCFVTAAALVYVLWEVAPHVPRLGLILSSLLALGLLGFAGWKMWPRPKIEVEPLDMKFVRMGDTYDIKVRNASDVDVYVVEVLFRAKTDEVSDDDFYLDVPNESLRKLEGISQNLPAYDLYVTSCKANGKLIYVFSIDHMAPHEVRHIVINYKGAGKVELAGEIANIETSQTPIRSWEGTAATRVIPFPKNLGCGMSRIHTFGPKPQ